MRGDSHLGHFCMEPPAAALARQHADRSGDAESRCRRARSANAALRDGELDWQRRELKQEGRRPARPVPRLLVLATFHWSTTSMASSWGIGCDGGVGKGSYLTVSSTRV